MNLISVIYIKNTHLKAENQIFWIFIKKKDMKKIISPNTIKQAIIEEAFKLKRKKELFEEVKKINSELAQINEGVGMVASFGFNSPADNMNKTKTGFVNDFQNISHVAALAAEMDASDKSKAINEDVLDEVAKLKEELQKLKEENESLKNK